jgi:hypothetical protein
MSRSCTIIWKCQLSIYYYYHLCEIGRKLNESFEAGRYDKYRHHDHWHFGLFVFEKFHDSGTLSQFRRHVWKVRHHFDDFEYDMTFKRSAVFLFLFIWLLTILIWQLTGTVARKHGRYLDVISCTLLMKNWFYPKSWMWNYSYHQLILEKRFFYLVHVNGKVLRKNQKNLRDERWQKWRRVCEGWHGLNWSKRHAAHLAWQPVTNQLEIFRLPNVSNLISHLSNWGRRVHNYKRAQFKPILPIFLQPKQEWWTPPLEHSSSGRLLIHLPQFHYLKIT